MGKGRLVKTHLKVPRLKVPRLTRRVVLGTVTVTVALGGGTAGALLSTGVAPSSAARMRTTQPLGRAPLRIDPGGPIILAPGPSPASASAPPAPLAPAPAPTPTTTPPPPVGAAALSEISYPWQQLGYQIVFLGPRPDLMGQTIFDQRRIEIYLRSGESTQMVAHVIAHEIGHVADVAYNTPDRRQEWLRLRGAPTSQPWFGCDGCDDFSSPAGDYAETFSFWQLGAGADESRLAPTPSPDQLRQLIPLFYASTPNVPGASGGRPAPSASGGSRAPRSSNPRPGGPSCLTIVCTS